MFTQVLYISLSHIKEDTCSKNVIHQITRDRSVASFSNFTVKRELVFDLTQNHASWQSFLTMTNEKNVISSAELYTVLQNLANLNVTTGNQRVALPINQKINANIVKSCIPVEEK